MKPRTKKRIVALALVLAVIAGGAVGLRHLRSARKAETIAEARARGMDAYDRGEWQAAMDDLGLYVHRGGRRDGAALFRLADARLRKPEPNGSHLTTAIGILRDAIAAPDPDPRAAPMLLDCYLRTGGWADVLSLTEQMARAADPDHALFRARVRAHQGLGRHADAIAESDRLVAAFPLDPSAHRVAIRARFDGSGSPDTAVRQYLDAPDGLGRLSDPLAGEIVRAEALEGIRDPAAALAACRRAIDAGVPSDRAEDIAALFDVLDSLSSYRTDASAPPAVLLASELLERLVGRDDLSQASRVALVCRNWRAGARNDPADLLGPALSDPSHADASALGWALVAGAVQGEAADPIRAALESRDNAQAAFWSAIANTIAALETGSADAPQVAAACLELASRLEGDPSREQALAAYLRGAAQAVAGRYSAAEDTMLRVGRLPGWRIARQEALRLMLRRGDHQAAQAAMAGFPGFGTGPREFLLACQVFVGLAEHTGGAPTESTSGAGHAAIALTNLQRLKDGPTPARSPEVEALLARAYAVNGDPQGAAAATDEFLRLASEEGAVGDRTMRLALQTASCLRPRLPDQADRLVAFAAAIAPDDPDVLFERAIALHLAAASEGQDTSVALLEQAIADAGADADRAFEIRRRLALLLDARIERAEPATRTESIELAADTFRALADLAADNLDLQLDVLRSRSAWSDEPLVQSSIARVRTLAGDDAPEWRVYEARRLLAFEPAAQGPTRQDRARTALTEVLAPVIRSGDDPRAFELAARAWDILGNGEENIRMLREAVAASDAPAALYPRLIAALRDAGRPDEARGFLNQFCDLGDVGPLLSRDRATLLETYAVYDRAIAERERLAESGLSDDLLALARVYAAAGRGRDASAAFDRLASMPDPTPQALEAAADFRAATGDVEGGLALLERPESFRASVDRALAVGRFLDRHASRAEAVERVRAFADSDAPSDDRAAAWRWLARTHARAGDLDEAVRAIDAGLALSPTDEPLLALRALTSAREPGDVFGAALAAVAGDSRVGESMSALIDLLSGYAAGRVDQVQFVARLTEQTQRWPTSIPTWSVLLQARVLAGDSNAAARDASRLMQSVDEPAAMELASRVFASIGQSTSARSAAVRWREQTPGNPIPADVQLATLDIDAGSFAQALRTLTPHLDAILAAEPPDPYAARAAALAIVSAGTAQQQDRLAAKAGEQADWAIAAAEAGARLPDAAAASRWLERLDGDTPDQRAALALAQAWVVLGERTGTAIHAERATRIIASRPWDASRVGTARRLEGGALRLLGRLDDSEAAFRAALQADPNDWGAAGALAEVLLEGGRPENAMREAARLQALVLGDPTAPSLARQTSADLLARCQIAEGALDEAWQTISDARAIFAGSPAIESRRMEIAAMRGDAREVESAIRAIPPDAGRIAAALIVADRLDETSPDAAALILRTAIALAPAGSFEYVSAANNLAYLLVVSGGHTEEAIEHATSAKWAADALRLPAEVLANILETLGRAQLAAGDAEQARATFDEALRLVPNAPDALLGLAEALRALHRFQEAEDALARIDRADRDAFTESQRVRYERLSSADGS
ncbi:MAG: tetratricopeptide repeat protein [Phycisphaerales bacterium]|nr:tetratricopeptide repeat protein [Phycisphaerales bacterium]MCB9840302.1 tetratricopeptide repeat protein [Phycisphaeraceae bacterium]